MNIPGSTQVNLDRVDSLITIHQYLWQMRPGTRYDTAPEILRAIMVVCCWAKGYQEPLYLVSNLSTAEEACRLYHKRCRIETFFSDQKSRGFHIHQSHIADPQRLSRLLIAACFAYIWVVYLGSFCEKAGWREHIHRNNRCD